MTASRKPTTMSLPFMLFCRSRLADWRLFFALSREGKMMKEVVLLLVFSLMVFAADPASTLPAGLGQPADPTEHALVERAQNCRPGSYYCPGEVPGCCPNGWGCGSRS